MNIIPTLSWFERTALKLGFNVRQSDVQRVEIKANQWMKTGIRSGFIGRVKVQPATGTDNALITLGEQFDIASWSYSGTTITINTIQSHTLITGYKLETIGLVCDSDAPNGIFEVSNVVSPNSVEFIADATPTGTPTVIDGLLGNLGENGNYGEAQIAIKKDFDGTISFTNIILTQAIDFFIPRGSYFLVFGLIENAPDDAEGFIDVMIGSDDFRISWFFSEPEPDILRNNFQFGKTFGNVFPTIGYDVRRSRATDPADELHRRIVGNQVKSAQLLSLNQSNNTLIDMVQAGEFNRPNSSGIRDFDWFKIKPMPDIVSGGSDSTEYSILSWTYSGTTITITLGSDHNYNIGKYIYVDGLISTTNTPFGTYVISSVPSSNTIEFTASSTPTGSPNLENWARVRGKSNPIKGHLFNYRAKANDIASWSYSDEGGGIYRITINTTSPHTFEVGFIILVEGLVSTTNTPNSVNYPDDPTKEIGMQDTKWIVDTVPSNTSLTFIADDLPTGAPTLNGGVISKNNIELIEINDLRPNGLYADWWNYLDDTAKKFPSTKFAPIALKSNEYISHKLAVFPNYNEANVVVIWGQTENIRSTLIDAKNGWSLPMSENGRAGWPGGSVTLGRIVTQGSVANLANASFHPASSFEIRK